MQETHDFEQLVVNFLWAEWFLYVFMVPGAYGGPMDLSPKGVGYEGCPTTLS